jgi:hypothetical protein
MSGYGSDRGRWAAGLRAAVVTIGALTAALAGGQVWDQGNQGLTLHGGSQQNAYFGQVVASGDFNGDGFRDLAVGTPAFDFDAGSVDCGRMQIHLGGPQGLSPSRYYHVTGGSAQMRFGATLAFGDFDGDGVDELAVGAPGFDAGGQDEAGRLYVYEFASPTPTQSFFDQNTTGIQDAAEPFDHFANALAVGDFDDDGFEDLAIGVPGENLEDPAPTQLDAGVVQILYGSASGLSDVGNQRFTQAALGGVQANARFGAVLAAGDFNEDENFEDLAIGIPERDVAAVTDAGQLVILRGTATGLLTTNSQVLDQTHFGLLNQTGDRFGAALATGDFDRTTGCWFSLACRTDLAVGLPGQDHGADVQAGAVMVAYGSNTGISLTGSQFFYQDDLLDGSTAPESNDNFGAALTSEWITAAELTGVLGAGGNPDHLVIGALNEDWVSDVNAGIVHLVFGGPTGLLSGPPGQFWFVGPGLAAAPIQGDARFGNALAIGDFDNDGHADLAVAALEQDVAGQGDAGLVQVLYGALFASGFEAGTLVHWSTAVVN